MDSVRFAEVLSSSIHMKARSLADGRAATKALGGLSLSLIEAVCKASMPQKTSHLGNSLVYWWMQDIADLSREIPQIATCDKQAKGRVNADLKSEKYKSVRKICKG